MNKKDTASIGPFAIDEALRAEADVLLYQLGLKKLIEEYAPVHITGSYALQLMVWRDLDIMMNAPGITVGQFFELGKRITMLLSPWKMFFTNTREKSSNDYPPGFYWGIRMGDIKRGAWKIDLWAFDSDKFREKVLEGEALKSRLTEQNRLVILNLKAQLWDKPEYRDTITSQDIYTAVLDCEIKTLDEFFRFIKEKR